VTRWSLRCSEFRRAARLLAGVFSPFSILPAMSDSLAPLPRSLALAAADVARLLNISQRHLWALHSSGRLGPLPVRLGRAVRWNAAELAAWMDADAPPRDRWLAMRRGGNGAA